MDGKKANRTENGNEHSKCLVVFLLAMIFSFVGCGNDSVLDEILSESNSDISIEREVESGKKKGKSEEYQEKFIEAAREFYVTYLDYFGSEFSFDQEPFRNGEYVGENREKYNELAQIIEDMCLYYENIEDEDDRFDSLGELGLREQEEFGDCRIFSYLYNIRQMIALIEGTDAYASEMFVIEYNEYESIN